MDALNQHMNELAGREVFMQSENEGEADFFAILCALIEQWCDRRCLRALHFILGGYIGFSGLTDSWVELRSGLQDVRAFAQPELTLDEMQTVMSLIQKAEKEMR